MPLLQRAAADGIRVMLDGEGGDELFGVARWLVADKLRQATHSCVAPRQPLSRARATPRL